MSQTVFIYSSHNCCHDIHENRIIQRALGGWSNKRILFLPVSEGPHPDGNEFPSQHFGYSKFSWFFDRYKQYGLEVIPFFFSSNLRSVDSDMLIHHLKTAEVVLLGGGQSILGMNRYRWIGGHFFKDPDLIQRLLHERQSRGLYTVGFSSGADQLCEYLQAAASSELENPFGFGLAKNIVVSLHFEAGRSGDVLQSAKKWGNCFAFGLPNDSGLGISQGWLNSGKIFQVIECVIDTSWDLPHDQGHIKTRQGVKIEHFYCDGRHWTFNSGDIIVRIIDPQTNSQNAFLVFQNIVLDYWTQKRTDYSSIQEILTSH